MRFFKEDTHFDFLGKGTFTMGGSAVVILLGVVAYVVMGGLNFGIDFTGGTLVQIRIERDTDISAVREALNRGDVGSFSLQGFGAESDKEFLITLSSADVETAVGGQSPAAKVEALLKESYPGLSIRRVETVGPKVGAELKTVATEAVLFSLLAILLYVWVRFQWRFSIGAIVALAHDVLFVLAAFVVTQKEISLPVVAAVLTVAGYSINDTIVILDRVRENMRKFQKRSLLENYNGSINQTLSRTVLTSGTTLLVVLSIYLFGGEIINDFAFALLIGIIVGTYSSVFIAAPLTYRLQLRFPPRLR